MELLLAPFRRECLNDSSGISASANISCIDDSLTQLETDPTQLYEQCENVIDYLLRSDSNAEQQQQSGDIAMFTKQWLPEVVECALFRKTQTEHVARTLYFLKTVLRYIVQFAIPHDSEGLLHSLLQIFSANEAAEYWDPAKSVNSPVCIPRFYSDHDSIRANFNDAIEPSPAAVEATSFHTEAFFQRSLRAATEKVPSVELMEEFGRLGGFSAIVQRLREPTHVGFARLRVFVRLAHVSRAQLNAKTFEKLVWAIKEVAPAVLLGVDDKHLKFLAPADFDFVILLIQENILAVIGQAYFASIKKAFTVFKLELHFSWFCSSLLEKRLQGLRQLRDVVEMAAKRTSSFSQRNMERPFDLQFLLGWLEDRGFVDELFGPHLHVEVLKRAVTILRILAQNNRVERHHLHSLWLCAKGAHEAVQRVLYSVITDLVPVLAPPHRHFLFERISSVSANEFDEPILHLVFNFTVRASQLRSAGASAAVLDNIPARSGDGRRRGQITHTPMRKLYGICIIWNFLHDISVEEASSASIELTEKAVALLVQLLRMPHFVSEREPLMQQCVENLERHHSVEVSLLTLQHILRTYPERRRGWVSLPSRDVDGSISGVIDALDRNAALLKKFFCDLEYYQGECRVWFARTQSMGNASPRNTGRVRINGVVQLFEYSEAVRIRLQFLTFILTNSSMILGESHVELLWDSLVEDSQSVPNCQEIALQWFQIACGSMVTSPSQVGDTLLAAGLFASSKDEFSTESAESNLTTGSTVAFAESVLPFLFQSKLQKLRPEGMSSPASKLFTQLFLYVNVRSKALRWVMSGDGKQSEWVRQSAELNGENFLWEVVMRSKDLNIVDTVMNLLIELNHRISPKLTQTKRDRISGDFVRKCIHRLSVFVPYLNLGDTRSENSLHDIDQSIDTDPPPLEGKDAAQFVSRCVLLLQRFLERFYEHPYGKIRIDLLSARSSAVAKQIFLHGSLTVADLRKAAADIFGEAPCNIKLSRPQPSRFPSAFRSGGTESFESVDNDEVCLDDMKLQSRPTVIVAKKEQGAQKKGYFETETDLLKFDATTTPLIDAAIPYTLLSVLPSSVDDSEGWDSVLAPPIAYKEDMVLTAGIVRPFYGRYRTPAVTVPLEAHLAQFPHHFEQLFSLLDLQLVTNTSDMITNVSAMVWRILQVLPTHMTLLRDLRSLEVVEDGSWKTLLDASSLFKTLSALQIIDAFLTAGATYKSSSNTKSHFAWASKFLHLGGVEHLISILMNVLQELENDTQRNEKFIDGARVEAHALCVALIYRILYLLLQLDPMYSDSMNFATNKRQQLWGEHRTPPGMVVSVVDMKLIVDLALKLLLCMVKMRPSHRIMQNTAAHVMQLVKGCIRSSAEACKSFCHFSDLEKWLHAFTLRFPNPGTRHITCSSLLHMCMSNIYDATFGESFEIIVLRHLLPLIPSVSEAQGHSAKNLFPTHQSEQFFSLVCGVVLILTWPKAACSRFYDKIEAAGSSPVGRLPFSPPELIQKVWGQLTSHFVSENFENMSEIDQSFAGLLRLLAILLHGLRHNGNANIPISLVSREVINFIYRSCLFSSLDDETFLSDNMLTFGPRCKSNFSRSMAYAVLIEVCMCSKDNLNCLLDFMQCEISHAKATDQILESELQTKETCCATKAFVAPMPRWNYDPASFLRESGQRIGLSNQGATCYMNALFQQLFYTKRFSLHLLQIDAGNGDAKDSVLHQLQALFSHLKLSQKKYHDTLPFCKAFRDFDGKPIEVNEQKDVYEFGTMLFDKLENSHSEVRSLLKENFGGKLVYQVISQESETFGEQLSELTEPFFMLTAEVKNKNSLQDSMELYVAGEPLSGDNKYDHNGEKVEALRRCAIRELPPTLIVHLKRFEYDLTTYTKCKVNDYFSFPMKLNMLPYTEEGTRKQLSSKTLDEARTGIKEEDCKDKGNGSGRVILSPKSDECDASPWGGETPANLKEPASASEEVFDTNSGSSTVIERSESYYRYSLKGIVAHTGTVDSGHYYSFIREFDAKSGCEQWIEFNDQNVIPFSEDSIPKECFGGIEETNSHTGRGRERNNNAYLLIYDRVLDSPPSSKSIEDRSGDEVIPSPNITDGLVQRRQNQVNSIIHLSGAINGGKKEELPDGLQMHSRLRKTVSHDLMVFLNDRHIYSIDYFRFIWTLTETAAATENGDKTDPRIRLEIFKVGLRFAVLVMAHARAKQCIQPWCTILNGIMQSLPGAAEWTIDFFSTQLGFSWLSQMIIECPHSSTKSAFVELITKTLISARKHQKLYYLVGEDGTKLDFCQITTPETNETTTNAGDPPNTSQQTDNEVRVSSNYQLIGQPRASITVFMRGILNFLENKHTVIFNMSYLFQLLHNFSLLGVEERSLLLRLRVPSRAAEYSVRIFPGTDSSVKPMMKMLAQIISQSHSRDVDADEISVRAIDAVFERSLLRRSWLDGSILAQPSEAATIICHMCWEEDSDRANLLYKFVLERVLESTSGQTNIFYRAYFLVLREMLQMQDSRQLHRLENYLPHLLHRCPRLSDRQAPGDDEFIFDVSKLCLSLAIQAPPLCRDFVCNLTSILHKL